MLLPRVPSSDKIIDMPLSIKKSLLSADAVDLYKKQGVVRTDRPVFSDEKFHELKRLVDRTIEKNLKPDQSGTLAALLVNEPEFIRFAAQDSVLDLIEPIIGPNIGIISANIFVKRPHTEQYVQWHTDAHSYQRLRLMDRVEMTALLIAITPSTIETGCVQYIAGSHLKKSRQYKNKPYTNCLFGDEWGYSGVEDFEVDRDSEVIQMQIPQGYGSLHDVNVVHGSQPNQSGHERILLNFKFFPTDIKIDSAGVLEHFKSSQDGYLLRGSDLGQTCAPPLIDLHG